jgi:hypothetical protein
LNGPIASTDAVSSVRTSRPDNATQLSKSAGVVQPAQQSNP